MGPKPQSTTFHDVRALFSVSGLGSISNFHCVLSAVRKQLQDVHGLTAKTYAKMSGRGLSVGLQGPLFL